jgi:hypothetical protein
MDEATYLRTAISQLLNRASLDNSGTTFGTKRDIYRSLGYRPVLRSHDYWDRYKRGGIAKRIVETFPKSTWRGGAVLVETEDAETSTAFELACEELDKRLKLWQVFQRADILAGLGHYSVILLGAPGAYADPLESCPPQELKYLATFSERDITIDTLITTPTDERFGFPEYYTINYTQGTATRPISLSGRIHHSRTIHVVEGSLDHPLFGPPRLEAVWNYLDDLMKVVGGGSEAFWKRVDGGKQIKLDPTLPTPTPEQKKELHEQIEEYTHELRRVLTTRGVDIEDLGTSVSGFGGQVASIMDLISTTTGIPQRILMGSERGELASTTDQSNYDDRVEDRRNDFAGPSVVRPFVDRLIALGTLPTPSDYYVRWPEIKNLNEAQRMTLATAAATLNSLAGETIVTPGEIRDKILGLEPLSPEQVAEEKAKKAEKVAEAQAAFTRGPKEVPPKTPFGKRPNNVGEEEPTAALGRALAHALEADNYELAQSLVVEALNEA